jgi:hypothetical protein
MVDRMNQVLATVASAVIISIISSGLAVYVATQKLEIRHENLERHVERCDARCERLVERVREIERICYSWDRQDTRR